MMRRPSALAGCLVAIALLIVAGVAVTSSANWTRGEFSAVLAINASHSPALDAIALAINLVFSPPGAAMIVVAGFALFLIVTRRLVRALEFATMVGISWLGSDIIKMIVHRPRPDHTLLQHPLIIETTNSYPSGHTAFVASLAMTIIVIARGWRWQPLVIAVGAIITLLTAASRVYLGVHYPTDVTASIVYAAAAVTAIALVWSIGRSPLRDRLPLRTGSRPRTR
jgi:membrane-associated phospholipid phosphatase